MKQRWKLAQFFEAFWWRLYLWRKPMADYLAWKRRYWQSFLSDNGITVAPRQSILDMGCGPAGIYMVFAQNPVTAVDPLLGHYRKRFAHLCKDSFPNVRFLESPFEHFEPDQRFDLAFCINAINHVADLDVCFQKLAKSIQPAGRLILTVDAHNYLIFKKLFRLLPGDILHPHQYGLDEYQALLRMNGFDLSGTRLLKREFFFNYYLLDCTRGTN